MVSPFSLVLMVNVMFSTRSVCLIICSVFLMATEGSQ